MSEENKGLKKSISEKDLEKASGGNGPLLEPIDYYCSKCNEEFMGNSQNNRCPICGQAGTPVSH